jgi:hypothetical protein
MTPKKRKRGTVETVPLNNSAENSVSRRSKEALEVRDTLDNRYDQIKNGDVSLLDGEAFFENLRQREDQLLK